MKVFPDNLALRKQCHNWRYQVTVWTNLVEFWAVHILELENLVDLMKKDDNIRCEAAAYLESSHRHY
jgi:hypothetical protein